MPIPHRGEAVLERALRAAKIGLWDWNLRTDEVIYSEEWKRQVGYEADEFANHYREWETRIHPEDLPRIKKILSEYFAKPWPDYEAEFRIRHKDGSWRWVLTRAELIRDADGKPGHMLGSQIDITERKRAEADLSRANRALRMLTDANQMLVRITDEPALLREICQIIVQKGGYRMAWVGFVSPENQKTVKPAAQVGFEPGYFDSTDFTKAHGSDHSPIQIAIRTKQPCVARNLAGDPAHAHWREASQPRGTEAVVALPLTGEERVLGVLAIYAARAVAFDAEEVKTLTELAADLAFGLAVLRMRAARIRAEQALHRQIRMNEAMFNQAVSCFALLGRDYRFIQVNEAYAAHYGKTVAEVVGREVYEMTSEDMSREAARAIMDDVVHTKKPLRLYAMPFKFRDQPERGMTYWDSILQPVLDEHGEVEFLFFSAIDVTEQLQAGEDRLSHLRFFENLDRVNRAIHGSNDLEQMLSDVLGVLLTIFECDRAWLIYPCNPKAASWRVPMERTRPEYPGLFAVGTDVPMQPDAAAVMALVLDVAGPVRFDPESGHPIPPDVAQRYQIQSFIAMALAPKTGQPWMFGLHQCSRPRVWTPSEEKLFQEVGRRLADALTSLLTFRNLRTANARVGEILESITDAFLALDRDWRYTYVNERAAQIIGKSREDLIGQHLWDRVPEMIGADVHRELRRAMAEQIPVHFDCFAPTSGRWFESHVFPTKEGLSVYTTDISALKETERQFRTLTEHSPDIICRFDAACRYLYANDAVEKFVGVSPPQLIGKRFGEVLAPGRNPTRPEDLQAIRQAIERVFATGAATELETKISLGDHEHLFNVRLIPERDATGQVVSALHIARDITEHKRAEDALRWKTAFFEAQVDSALDGILVVDRQGRKVLQNRRMNELWKLPREIVENKDDSVQLRYATSRTKNPGEFAAKVAYLYSHPDEISRDEVELVDGTILDRYSSPVRDKAGNLYGRIWTFRDITAGRKLEEQFRQSQKMEAVGQLAGGIAHDFNNLLTVIQMQSSLLLDVPSDASQTKEGIQQIMGATERAANLTRQLLTFSRRSVREARDIDLGEVAKSMTKLVQRLLGEDITVETRVARALPLINADAGMMEQIVMNLVVNARDAMPQGGRLVISVELVKIDEAFVATHPQARTGQFVCLAVSDTGCGIPPENVSRIFEPFFTTKDIGKGTGLGLATVFGIVEQHHGWIAVTSEVNRGSTFQIFLPAPETAKAHSPVSEPEPIVRGGTETILLVEDEPFVRELARAVLERYGYRVLEASSAVAALQLWNTKQIPVDLLLTDLIMPGGLSGNDLADQLKAKQPSLKIIYTSGYSNDVVNRTLRLDPGRNFLRKPCSAADLAAIVRRALDEV